MDIDIITTAIGVYSFLGTLLAYDVWPMNKAVTYKMASIRSIGMGICWPAVISITIWLGYDGILVMQEKGIIKAIKWRWGRRCQ